MHLSRYTSVRIFCLICLCSLGGWFSRAEGSPAPWNVFLSPGADPAHGWSVNWRSDAALAAPCLQAVRNVLETTFVESSLFYPARETSVALPDGRACFSYEVNLSGLLPGTSYCFRVGSAAAWSEWFTFRTASEEVKPFRIIYFGDFQEDVRSQCARVVRAAFRSAPDALFMLFAGDLIAKGYDFALWREFGEAVAPFAAECGVVPVPGNHDKRTPEYEKTKALTGPAPLWRFQFALPANGPASGRSAEETYYFDCQGVRFVCLDSIPIADDHFKPADRAAALASQLGWLKVVLAHNPNRWTVVLSHHPIYSAGKDRDNAEYRKAVEPLFLEYGVDLVLQAHDHVYSRSHKVAGGEVVSPEAKAPVYAISNAGPRNYPLNRRFENLMASLDAGQQRYQVIEFSGDRLRYTSYTADGVARDAFTLKKDARGASKYKTPKAGPGQDEDPGRKK